ncbi:MAG: DUF4433 domain-containing protein [Chloroflexota bacterium]|nr:DUF4433 domain-containing protein [Chloroflexota bacterium]
MVPSTVWLYHITAVDNLPSVLAQGGLLSNTSLQNTEVVPRSIAHATIQARREQLVVPCGPGGSIHDYVPFFLAPRPPMLYSVNRGQVSSYRDGQESIIYLVTTIRRVQQAGTAFVFTDGHATHPDTQMFSDLAQLNQIDWSVLESGFYWAGDAELKRRRQAEFLVHSFVPWPAISKIGVYNEAMRRRVWEILQDLRPTPLVGIHTEWYDPGTGHGDEL